MKLERLLDQSYNIYSVKITEEVFEKIKKYARLTSKTVGHDVECSGLLTNNQNDDVARDAILVEQDIGPSECSYPNNSIAEAYKQNKVVGIWHSHGSNPIFHSYYDDGHLKKIYILNSRKPPIKLRDNVKEIKGSRIEDNALILKISDWYLRIHSENPRLLKALITKTEKIKPEYFNFANSVVINNKGDQPYAESLAQKAMENPRTPDIKNTMELKNLELLLIDERNNITLDDKALLKEIGNKLRYNGKYLRDYVNFNKTNGYHARMRDFYTNYQVKDHIDNTICTIAKILAGDYRNNKRIWFWKDRIKHANMEYKKIKKKLSKEQQLKLNRIIKNVKKHRYVNKKHSKKLKSIYRMGK